ncbi:MAG: glycosyltransferase [Deinococcus sp.]|nr:glycosyltransferase [Deinococcus sp.]
MTWLSVIVPAYREGHQVLRAIDSVLAQGSGLQVVVVVRPQVGDDTVRLVQEAYPSCVVLEEPRPTRAAALNRGAAQAVGKVLLFLHADTVLPPGAFSAIQQALASGAVGGGFLIGFPPPKPQVRCLLRLAERWCNYRSARWRVFYGDQAMFLRREVFQEIGGFPELEIMEDFALAERLVRYSRARELPLPALIPLPVEADTRRFQDGVWYYWLTIFLVRLGYGLGVPSRYLRYLYVRKRVWYYRLLGLCGLAPQQVDRLLDRNLQKPITGGE